MLAAHSMGSHGGQQNFPFGYIPNQLHGIGLPDFMTPGPPPGQPLLNEHDNQTLDSFFNGFDAGGNAGKDGPMQQYNAAVAQGQAWMMPPTLVGSETSLRNRPGTEWQNTHMNDFAFGSDMNAATMTPSTGFEAIQGDSYNSHGQFDNNVLHQLQSAAHATVPNFATTWEQSFNSQGPSSIPPPAKPSIMRFGSDQHFQPSGYTAPEGQFDHDAVPNLDWLEAQSSAANTQPNTRPNTRPNTQPSSPVWTKKRKLDDYQGESRQNGLAAGTNGHASSAQPSPPVSVSQNKRGSVKADAGSQPPTPISPSRSNNIREQDGDAEYEDDERSPSPAPWPANKPRPPKSKHAAGSSKPTRPRKKSTASSAPVKLKSKPSRGSSSATPSARVPLTADQKKANHTNSEQRRRDATSRAYAELYDLVPELEELGKQSTMKKLEVVVTKVETVKAQVARLRARLGFDIDTGGQARPSYPVAGANMFGSSSGTWQR